jgi:hypothetical protein
MAQAGCFAVMRKPLIRVYQAAQWESMISYARAITPPYYATTEMMSDIVRAHRHVIGMS